MRNQFIVNALRNAESHLLHAKDSNLTSAVTCLLSAVKEMADTEGVDPSDYDDAPDSYPDLYDYPDDEVWDTVVFIDEDSHVEAWDQFVRRQETAEYMAHVAACRARAVAAFAGRKVTRGNPSGR
jgi:hypothetical protein